MTEEIAPIAAPKDTKYTRHIRIQSQLLTRFWGRPMFLGANILVPEGFDEHPEARYPLAVFHGHFPEDVAGFRTEPPDPNLKPVYSERFHLLSAVDRARVSALFSGGDPACESLL